jgi:hypothetical protein
MLTGNAPLEGKSLQERGGMQNQIRHNSFVIKIPRLYSQIPIEIRKQSCVNFFKLLESINLDQFLTRPTLNL